MKDEVVSYSIAILAKELGFKGFCIGYYYKDKGSCKPLFCYFPYGLRDDDCSDSLHCLAPTRSMVQRWIREKHGIDVLVNATRTGEIKVYHAFIVMHPNTIQLPTNCDTYEQAFELGLKKSLKLIKDNNGQRTTK